MNYYRIRASEFKILFDLYHTLSNILYIMNPVIENSRVKASKDKYTK